MTIVTRTHSELMISRIRGLLSLADLGYKEDVIQLDERINDVFGYIKNALKSPDHDLFKGKHQCHPITLG